MKWSFGDAVSDAVSMYLRGEIAFDDVDKVANEIWQEMQKEDEEK